MIYIAHSRCGAPNVVKKKVSHDKLIIEIWESRLYRNDYLAPNATTAVITNLQWATLNWRVTLFAMIEVRCVWVKYYSNEVNSWSDRWTRARGPSTDHQDLPHVSPAHGTILQRALRAEAAPTLHSSKMEHWSISTSYSTEQGITGPSLPKARSKIDCISQQPHHILQSVFNDTHHDCHMYVLSSK